jgi:hypothetical protein
MKSTTLQQQVPHSFPSGSQIGCIGLLGTTSSRSACCGVRVRVRKYKGGREYGIGHRASIKPSRRGGVHGLKKTNTYSTTYDIDIRTHHTYTHTHIRQRNTHTHIKMHRFNNMQNMCAAHELKQQQWVKELTGQFIYYTLYTIYYIYYTLYTIHTITYPLHYIYFISIYLYL